MYIYPENMGKKMSLFFWTLRDGIISMALALLGLYLWFSAKIPVVFAGAGVYAFLSIQLDDTTMMDYLSSLLKYTVFKQQYFD